MFVIFLSVSHIYVLFASSTDNLGPVGEEGHPGVLGSPFPLVNIVRNFSNFSLNFARVRTHAHAHTCITNQPKRSPTHADFGFAHTHTRTTYTHSSTHSAPLIHTVSLCLLVCTISHMHTHTHPLTCTLTHTHSHAHSPTHTVPLCTVVLVLHGPSGYIVPLEYPSIVWEYQRDSEFVWGSVPFK